MIGLNDFVIQLNRANLIIFFIFNQFFIPSLNKKKPDQSIIQVITETSNIKIED